MIPPIWHLGKDKTMEKVKRLVFVRGRREGWIGKSLRILRNAGILYETTIADDKHLWKCIEYTIPRVSPNVNYGLWWLWHVKVSSSIITNVPLWCVLLIVREVMGTGKIWERSVALTQFCCGPKTSLIIKFIIQNVLFWDSKYMHDLPHCIIP